MDDSREGQMGETGHEREIRSGIVSSTQRLEMCDTAKAQEGRHEEMVERKC
jgi:hypothetical protein